MSNMVSLHIPSFAPDGIFLCIISFPPSSPCGRFFCLKRKRKRKKENPCCASSSLLYGKNNGKSFPLFFLKQERKRQVQDHHSFLIFPFGRRTYKRGISFLSPLAEVIMHHLSLLFLSWRRKRKKEENASIHMQESFAFFVRAEEEKRTQTKWRISPPLKKKREKEKDEKTEKRRQKGEGQKWKGTERREKDGRNGNGTYRRKAYSWRRRAEKEQKEDFPPERKKRGQRTLFFASRWECRQDGASSCIFASHLH